MQNHTSINAGDAKPSTQVSYKDPQPRVSKFDRLRMLDIGKSISRAEKIARPTLDKRFAPSIKRLRENGIDTDPRSFDDHLTSSSRIVVSDHGGSIQSFMGGRTHVTGCFASAKRKRIQHWESTVQRDLMLSHECDFNILWAQTEAVRFHVVVAGKARSYRCDSLALRRDGIREVIETKRNAKDLRDPEYRLVLAHVAELCRRLGWVFRIVFADEVFVNRQHRLNVQLFTDHRFTRIERQHLSRLRQAEIDGLSSYGEIAQRLEPLNLAYGRAIIQAFQIRRFLEMDLVQAIHDGSQVCFAERSEKSSDNASAPLVIPS